MDKKALNNEIVSMRPAANKAKVHTICKLNREIKHLRVVKDFHSEGQKQKNLQKAERLVKDVLLMKKLKHDDISKFALRHTKHGMTAMLATPSTSTEFRCLCRLGLHQGLVMRVEKLRSKFPNWEATLASLIASIGVKVKRRKVLVEQVGLLKENKTNTDDEGLKNDSDTGDTHSEEEFYSEQDDASDKAHSEKEADSGQGEVNSSSDSDVQTKIKPSAKNKSVVKSVSLKKVANNEDIKEIVRGIKVKRIKPIKKSKNRKVKVKLSKQIQEDLNSRSDIDGEDELEPSLATQDTTRKKLKKIGKPYVCEEVKVSKEINNISKTKEVKKKAVANRSKEMKVMRFVDLLETDLTPNEPINVTNTEQLATVTSVDSFFVGEDGKSAFLSTVPMKEPIIEKPNNHVSQPVYDHLGRRLNRREIRAHLHGRKSFKTFSSGFPSNSYNNKKWVDASTHEDNIPSHRPKILPPPPEEPLHPSWEAKKRQKEQLNTAFQGKKIKFDE